MPELDYVELEREGALGVDAGFAHDRRGETALEFVCHPTRGCSELDDRLLLLWLLMLRGLHAVTTDPLRILLIDDYSLPQCSTRFQGVHFFLEKRRSFGIINVPVADVSQMPHFILHSLFIQMVLQRTA